MSRFKLFAVMQMALMSIMHSPKLSAEEKQDQSKALNRRSGGIIFSNGPIPSRLPNQRQRRKLDRQMNRH